MAKTYEKSRYWAMIYYPESSVQNYGQYFSEKGIRAIVSPWHDKDINEDTGELKKKHKHIILCWDGPATESQAKKIADDFNSPIPIAQVSIKGAVLYLTHTNNPEKAQYDKKDIEVYGYESINEVIDLLESDIRNIWTEIFKKMDEGMVEYSDLMQYYLNNGYVWEFQYVRDHTLSIKGVMDSYRAKKKKDEYSTITKDAILKVMKEEKLI